MSGQHPQYHTCSIDCYSDIHIIENGTTIGQRFMADLKEHCHIVSSISETNLYSMAIHLGNVLQEKLICLATAHISPPKKVYTLLLCNVENWTTARPVWMNSSNSSPVNCRSRAEPRPGYWQNGSCGVWAIDKRDMLKLSMVSIVFIYCMDISGWLLDKFSRSRSLQKGCRINHDYDVFYYRVDLFRYVLIGLPSEYLVPSHEQRLLDHPRGLVALRRALG